MYAQGMLTKEDLRKAIELHSRSQHRRFGDCLREIGAVTETQLATAVGLQWSCPVLSETAPSTVYRYLELVPALLLKRALMVPVGYNSGSKVLQMAFATDVDHAALYCLEQVLECRTQACIATQSFVEAVLERTAQNANHDQALFVCSSDREIARISRSYAVQTGAEKATATAWNDLTWIRLHGRRTMDLLFSSSHVLDKNGFTDRSGFEDLISN